MRGEGQKGHVSFKTVAENVGVGDFWQPGSKSPMIIALIEKTFSHRVGRLEPLILEIVRGGLRYRQKQGTPVTAEEIDRLNGFILDLGFKFPDLWDQDFRASLHIDAGERARRNVSSEDAAEKLRETGRCHRSARLEEQKRQFFALHQAVDRRSAGIALEDILNQLFELNGLKPREPFRVVGEQIDGSFELDHEIYLLEAKWQQDPTQEKDLLVFRGKVEGKSKYTRGVFISVNGFTKDAGVAITKGKEACFFMMDGYDLLMVLEDNIDLIHFLRLRQRILAEEGAVTVPYNQLDLKRTV